MTPGVSRGWRIAVVVVCAAGGFMLGTAHSFSAGEDLRDRSTDLSTLVREAEARVAADSQRAAELQKSVEAAAAADLSPQVAKALAQADAARPAAQMTPVAGPGLSVSLTDAPRDADGNYPVDAAPDDLVVHQQDVQSVVNALWAGGAEAMMIQDQRVLTTSAVRCIGNTLLLQGRTYSPPFVVRAIGDPTRLAQSLEVEPGVQLFRHYVERYRLGFEVAQLDDIAMPGFDGPIPIAQAQQGIR